MSDRWEEFYQPPEDEYPERSDEFKYNPPTGAPPPSRYQPTAAGYVPQAQYQNEEPPYGYQYHQGDGQQDPSYQQAQSGQQQQPYFEYSQCNGRKKALLIGINYYETDYQLKGCINDARNVEKFICERFGYNPSDVIVLTDDTNDERAEPTRENIIRAMNWLVDGAQKNDSLFLHYSGHGTQVADVDGDESDGDDEAICPVDFDEAGLIIDDEIHEICVKPLPPGCRLTAIFDSCHSGTVLDLPYVYSTEGKIKEPDLFAGAQQALKTAGMDFMSGNTAGMMSTLMGTAKSVYGRKEAEERTRLSKTSPADVIQWAGCTDAQTSADTQEAGKSTGAMSYCFIAALTKYPRQSYQQLLLTVREEMRGKFTQKPQLSSCHPIDTDLEFVA
ncbi:metacaspase [Naematelia encephala]|uniref:Metacaspase n=1 Tax=Naematelia encephala TaxID=71784 RepID=A0A1Y2BBA5_9TREE|nr:metacaspase [Naematelia encephala]